MLQLKGDILKIIKSTGTSISDHQIQIIDRGLPHKPVGLSKGKMGVYSFIYESGFLKIGKAGQKSNARFTSQHYSPNSSQSNLAKSILKDEDFKMFNLSEVIIGQWIKENVRRIDFLVDESLGIFVLNFIEAYLHLKFKPKYEGFNNQRI